jgi:hypothetical protein
MKAAGIFGIVRLDIMAAIPEDLEVVRSPEGSKRPWADASDRTGKTAFYTMAIPAGLTLDVGCGLRYCLFG